jgi:tetratricopeptide (TPR) repeat protein
MEFPGGTGGERAVFSMTRNRVVLSLVGLFLLVIVLAPGVHVVRTFVALAAFTGSLASILFVLTFWKKSRVQIGRLKLRYKQVRRSAGAIAVGGFALFLAQRISLAVWHRSPTPQVTTTRFAADRLKILADLKARRFDALEKELRSYQEQAEREVSMEDNAVFAIGAFSNTEPALGPLLDEWERRLPDSYVPHLAKAEYLIALGFKARGDKWTDETSKQQFDRMNDYFTRGVPEVKEVISRDKRVAEAYVLLIRAAKRSEGADLVRSIAVEGLAEVPASFAIRRAFITSLEPRWGGSYDAMEKFARDSEARVNENPEIAGLKGFPDYDRAAALTWSDDYADALPLYTRAIAEGGDVDLFYRDRGRALQKLGRSADALADFERADQLGPQNPDTLVAMAYALVYLGRTKEARDKLDIAAQLAEPDEDAQRLRDQLAHTAD